MNVGQAGGVSKVGLSDRQGKGVPVALPCPLAPNGHLTKEMCDAGKRVPSSNIYYPLGEDRPVGDAVTPECLGNAGVLGSYLTKIRMGQAKDRGARQGD